MSEDPKSARRARARRAHARQHGGEHRLCAGLSPRARARRRLPRALHRDARRRRAHDRRAHAGRRDPGHRPPLKRRRQPVREGPQRRPRPRGPLRAAVRRHVGVGGAEHHGLPGAQARRLRRPRGRAEEEQEGQAQPAAARLLHRHAPPVPQGPARDPQGADDPELRPRDASTACTPTTSSTPRARGARFATAGSRSPSPPASRPKRTASCRRSTSSARSSSASRASRWSGTSSSDGRARRPDRRHDQALARRAATRSRPAGSSSTACTRTRTSSTARCSTRRSVPPGIELSDDPVLHFRSESYIESQKRRLAETKPAIKPE